MRDKIERTRQAFIELTRNYPKCEFVPTHGEGEHIARTRGVLNGRKYKVTYDLNLCKWCGNLEGSPNNKYFCPALAPKQLTEPMEGKMLSAVGTARAE